MATPGLFEEIVLGPDLDLRDGEISMYPATSSVNLHEAYAWSRPFYTDFEVNYNGAVLLTWSRRNWIIAPISAILYLILIRVGVKWMESRKAYDLRGPLRAWNLFLAVFSLWGALRLGPHLLHMWYSYGTECVFCTPPAFTFGHGPAGLWTILFVYSKYFELIDTLFIVLRKRDLSFLHWYHHVTVLLYSWDSTIREQPLGIVFAAMNLTVHAMMYFYYFLTASGHRPKWGMVVTVFQISQMVVGVGATVLGMWYSVQYPMITKLLAADALAPLTLGCYVSRLNLYAGSFMYFTYLLLFLDFFFGRYFGSSKVMGKKDAVNGVTSPSTAASDDDRIERSPKTCESKSGNFPSYGEDCVAKAATTRQRTKPRKL